MNHTTPREALRIKFEFSPLGVDLIIFKASAFSTNCVCFFWSVRWICIHITIIGVLMRCKCLMVCNLLSYTYFYKPKIFIYLGLE